MRAERVEKSITGLGKDVEEEKTELKEEELSEEKIPSEARNVLGELEREGYEAYLVGGCVRDLLLARRSESEGGRGVKPSDWDVTTNARPEDISRIFPRSFYENKFGTVTVVNETPDSSLRHIEITPYRMEGKYTDKRHPDEIKFAETLEEDLKRRDFTVNAMAARVRKGRVEIKDFFNGRADLKNKVIRAVGNPKERFQEDALRLMRAPRFAARLGFKIEKETELAIKENAKLLSVIAKERIRDELLKIIESKNPAQGIKLLSELGLFPMVFPEVSRELSDKNFSQAEFPSLKKTPEISSAPEVGFASFFLDLKKIKEMDEVKLAKESLKYLKLPKRFIEKVAALLKGDNFVGDFNKLDKLKMRRLWKILAAKGRIDDEAKRLMEDFLGFQKLQRKSVDEKKIEAKRKALFEASKDPLFLKDIKVSGRDIIEILKIKPGPEIGKILNALLEEVIEKPKRNERKYLISEAKRLRANLANSKNPD